jgi:lactoylglutathione lyase
VALRAFPVLYARDVEVLARFYAALGFTTHSTVPGEDGSVGFVGLRRDAAELAITTEASPRMLAGVEPGPGPRHELFVYVTDVESAVEDATAAGGSVLRDPTDMPWGERLAFVRDPEGNVVTLAASAGRAIMEG